jgi:hypothetical protein
MDEDIVSTITKDQLLTVKVKRLYLFHPGIIVVTIDLSVPTFRPGNKSYDRAKWCLENNLSQSFKMVMTRVDISKCHIGIESMQ